MADIPDGSVGAIIADLPYGTTACRWDTVIPFEPLWAAYKRIIKPSGAIVLTACQPFTSALIMSNPKWFRYELIWEKTMPTGFLDANRKPMRNHENVLIFAKGRTTYHPQMASGQPYTQRRRWRGGVALTSDQKILSGPSETVNTGFRFPRSVTRFSNCEKGRGLHPTQKPVALFEYLVRTYTNEGDTVLDNCFGSCTTGEACLRTGRNFIGIERDDDYFRVGVNRIQKVILELGHTDAGQPLVSYGTAGRDKQDCRVGLLPVLSGTRGRVACDEQE